MACCYIEAASLVALFVAMANPKTSSSHPIAVLLRPSMKILDIQDYFDIVGVAAAAAKDWLFGSCCSTMPSLIDIYIIYKLYIHTYPTVRNKKLLFGIGQPTYSIYKY